MLNPGIKVHDREIYSLQYEAVWATLSAFGLDPKRLGVQLGMTTVLHTWGQTLMRHVHLHCLVPGVALPDQGQWNPAKGIRHFGFLANRSRRQHLTQIRTSIEAKESDAAGPARDEDTPDRPCPKCRTGRLRVVGEIAPRKRSCRHRSG